MSYKINLEYNNVSFMVELDEETYQLVKDPQRRAEYAAVVYEQFFADSNGRTKNNTYKEANPVASCSYAAPSIKALEDQEVCPKLSDTPKLSDSEDSKIWSNENILLLISLYKKYEATMESSIKKRVWQKISDDIRTKTGLACTFQQAENKWKALKRKYIEVKTHNSRSGAKKKTWQYFMAMEDILFNKPEVVAPATASSFEGLHTREKNDENHKETSFQRKRKMKTSDVERRHREKMQRIDNLTQSINKLIECTIKKKRD